MTTRRNEPDTNLSPVRVTTDGAVRTITMHRPEALGAFNEEMKPLLLRAVADVAADRSVRVVVITGSGAAFSAGQDLKEHLARVTSNDVTVARTVTDFYNPLMTAISALPQPVIAAVNGVAAGAGAALAMACDLRWAAAGASFSMAFAAAALSADSGASYLLPRLVGRGRALRMMLLGERVNAREAYRIGLVDEVVADAELAEQVAAVAERLADAPADALTWIKRSVRYAETHSLAESLAFESEAQQACFASANHREALDAFVHKRAPRFNQ